MEKNSKIIDNYIQHLKLGKPILNKKRYPIGDQTAKKIKAWLMRISVWINKDFEKINQKDIDQFRTRLKTDKFKQHNGKPFSSSTKRDIEYKIFRAFMQWLGKADLVYYVDQYNEIKEIPALSREEVERMISASKLRDKVILAVLFDSGARAEEFANIRFSDIKDEERASKGYYMVRIRISKTKARTIGLFLDITTETLDAWLEENKDKIGTNQPLVKLSYPHLRMTLQRIGQRVIKKPVHPHLLRHSSATDYCHKLNQYQMCKRYGWSMNSKMPQLYIDREGVDDEEIGTKIQEEQTGKYRKEVNKLKEQLNILQDREIEKDKQIQKMLSKMTTIEELEKSLKKKLSQ